MTHFVAKEGLFSACVELNPKQAASTTLKALGVSASSASRATNNHRVRARTAHLIAAALGAKVLDLFEVYSPRKHPNVRRESGGAASLPPAYKGLVRTEPAEPEPAEPEPAASSPDEGPVKVDLENDVLHICTPLSLYTSAELVELMRAVKG